MKVIAIETATREVRRFLASARATIRSNPAKNSVDMDGGAFSTFKFFMALTRTVYVKTNSLEIAEYGDYY